jgi:hypothetical protein
MRIAHVITLCAVLISLPSAAQQTDSLVGKWSGVMTTQKGAEVGVELTLTDSGGTWHMSMRGGMGRQNPCLGRDLPVVVKSQSATALTMDISGASVLRGCIDATATLTSADGKRLEGTLDDGRSVKLTRR